VRDRDDENPFIVGAKQQGMREPLEQAPANLVVEYRKGAGSPRDPCFSVSDRTQEAPTKSLASLFVESCRLEDLVIGLRMVGDLGHFNADSAARARACTWLDFRAFTRPLRTSSTRRFASSTQAASTSPSLS
jgi:hypothetical protein